MRLRIRFTKLGKIRWTSHRDVARMWERAFRRVELPLAYSEGFSPRPKVSFGLALPTGYESVAEYLDVSLRHEVDLAALPEQLSAALPVGVDAVAVAEVPAGTPSLQEQVDSCTWRWIVLGDDPTEAVSSLLASSSAIVARNRKGTEAEEDIRGGIINLQLIGPAGSDLSTPDQGWWLDAELACRPRSIRPAEVTVALASGWEEGLVRRTGQWILRDGARREPLGDGSGVQATDAPHVLGRAS